MSFPTHKKYVIIGAGIHGLSTAWHLAKELRARRRGSGRDILVIDKTSGKGVEIQEARFGHGYSCH
jgi:glycine/D-amino acid oxidase-like deaminating enzyme